jgi:hypothetical protein
LDAQRRAVSAARSAFIGADTDDEARALERPARVANGRDAQGESAGELSVCHRGRSVREEMRQNQSAEGTAARRAAEGGSIRWRADHAVPHMRFFSSFPTVFEV